MADFRSVYADNAATTRVSAAAREAMMPFLDEEFGNPSSLYTVGQRAKEALSAARMTVGGLLGARDPMKEIIFTSGGSEADNQAIISAAEYGALKGRKHIISTEFEHHAMLHTLDKLKKRGFDITLLKVNENGVVRVEDVAAAIRPDTILVSVMFANNEVGTLQPVSEIGALCRERGVFFHTDAVQAVGHSYINVQEMNIDLLSLSGHKFHAPKGVGALYARKGIPLVNIIEGGAQERGKRAGTENMPGIAALAAAMKESCENMEADSKRIIAMRERLISELSKIPHSKLNGDREKRVPGTVNFCFEGIEGESLIMYLDLHGIAASTGSACSSASLQASHVLLALGLPVEIAHGSLRLSVGEYNSDEDIDHIVEWVPKAVKRLRDMSPYWEELENGERPHLI